MILHSDNRANVRSNKNDTEMFLLKIKVTLALVRIKKIQKINYTLQHA